MGRYKALRNLVVGEGSKENHKSVQKGDVFECSDEFADEHLHPHGHVEETSEPLTSQVKKEKRQAAKAEKAGKAVPTEKKGDDDEKKKGKKD